MAANHPGQSPISFTEIALYFSSAEWVLLTPCQRLLYETVMMDNYENVTFVASVWSQVGKKRQQTHSSQQRDHVGNRLFTCQESGKVFSRSGKRKIRQRTHTGKKPHKCQECGKSFNISKNLKLYQRTHTGERPYKCQECGKTFSQRVTLKFHYRTHSGEKPYTSQEY